METATSLITEVRYIVQDEEQRTWSHTEVLTAADRVFGEIWETQRLARQSHLVDQVDLSTALFTQAGSEDVWELELPEYVGAVVGVWVAFSDGLRSNFLLPQIELLDSLNGRTPTPTWTLAGGGFAGTLRIHARISRFSTLRLYFSRRAVPLHAGTADGGSTSTVAFDTSPATLIGTVNPRPDVYVSSWVEFTSGANTGLRRQITAYDGVTATFAPVLGAAVDGTTAYSLLTPIADEHNSYLAWKVAERLIARSWDLESSQAIRATVLTLDERFRAALEERVTDNPTYLRMNP